MTGICSTCQSRHPVERLSGQLCMETHKAFGKHCEGSGDMPEAIIGETASERDTRTESFREDFEMRRQIFSRFGNY